MDVCLVVAMARNGAIGIDNSLPWRLPGDLKRFKEITLGHPIIMGRRTFESIGRALPGRTNIVVTRNAGWSADGVTVADSIEHALDAAVLKAEEDGVNEVMIIGGAELYRQCVDLSTRMYITEIHAEYAGDAYFPAIDANAWTELERREVRPENHEDPAYDFVIYQRRVA